MKVRAKPNFELGASEYCAIIVEWHRDLPPMTLQTRKVFEGQAHGVACLYADCQFAAGSVAGGQLNSTQLT